MQRPVRGLLQGGALPGVQQCAERYEVQRDDAVAPAGGGQALAEKRGAAGGFWTGALAAFVATPCSGPLLGAALGATLVLPAWAALETERRWGILGRNLDRLPVWQPKRPA